MSGDPHIFISYARAESAAFVERLRDDLTARGMRVWWDKVAMESRGLSFLQEIRDAIAGAERLLLVVGPRAFKSEYVRAEWRFALENCTVVTPLVRLGESTHVPSELAALHRVDFSQDDVYSTSLDELERLLRTPPALLGMPLNVDALPPHHVPRPELLVHLTEAVLADGQAPVVVPRGRAVVAVVGMTGSGKSVVTAAFARNCSTRRAFGDGLMWVKLRREDEPRGVLNQLCRLLGDTETHGTDTDAVAALAARLADKNCLIVLDDVWDTSIAERVADALGPTCRLLLTTQRTDLVLAAANVEVGLLSGETSRLLLARSAGYATETSLPAIAGEVIEACGSLPLSIAMVGSMLRGKPESRWAGILTRLRDVQLDHIRVKLPHYDHPSLLRAMHTSVEALREDENLPRHAADRYLDLAVFDRDASIPEAALAVLWEPSGLKEIDVQEMCDAFVDRSLLRRNEDGRYTLHNLQADYLQSQHADLPGLHRRFAESYKGRCAGRWEEGADDGYYFENLPKHLAAARDIATLQELLADAAWIPAKLAATDPWALASDARLVPPGQRGLELLYAALRMAAPVLSVSRDHLVPQLLGRLGGLREPVVVRLLNDLRKHVPAPWLEPVWPTLRNPDGPMIWSLEGYEGGAYSVAVTPDGRHTAIGTPLGLVMLWDLATARRTHSFSGPTSWAFGVAVSSDRSRVAAAFGEHGVMVWDVASGKSLAVLEGTVCAANSVAFTSDGGHIVTGLTDGSVRLWQVDGGQDAGVFEGRHAQPIQSLAVSSDGKRAVTGGSDGTLGFWDLTERTGRIIASHSTRVWAVAADREGKRAVSFADSGTVVLSAIESGNEIGRFNTGVWGSGCCLLDDGERLVTGDADGELKVWNLARGALVRTIRAHKSFVERVASVGGAIVISTSRDGTAKVWDLDREGGIEAAVHTAPVLGVAVSIALRGICSASQDRTMKVWDLASGALLSTLDGFGGPVRAVAFLPGSSRIITGDGQGQLTILDLDGVQVVARVDVHAPAIRKTEEGTSFGLGGVVALRVVKGGALAWSCGSAGDVSNLDLTTGNLTANRVSLEPPVVGDIAADGAKAVLGSGNGSLAIVNPGDDTSVTMKVESLSSFMSMVIDPNGKFAVSSHADGAVVCWALGSHAQLLIKPDPAGAATMVSWETGKREPVSASAHMIVARGLAVTEGGELLIVAFSDGWVRLWRLDTLEPYASFRCDEELYSCAVDGTLIVLGGRNLVHVLQIHTGAEEPASPAESS